MIVIISRRWLKLSAIEWATIISPIAAVGGVVASAVTFWKSFSKMKQSEQIRAAHDLRNSLFQAENNVLESTKSRNQEDVKFRTIQYLNVCEWYSFLVNKDQIRIKDIKDYFAPKMLEAYHHVLGKYDDLRDDPNKFKELKAMCKTLESEQVKTCL
jgi:hypothetical protein